MINIYNQSLWWCSRCVIVSNPITVCLRSYKFILFLSLSPQLILKLGRNTIVVTDWYKIDYTEDGHQWIFWLELEHLQNLLHIFIHFKQILVTCPQKNLKIFMKRRLFCKNIHRWGWIHSLAPSFWSTPATINTNNTININLTQSYTMLEKQR